MIPELNEDIAEMEAELFAAGEGDWVVEPEAEAEPEAQAELEPPCKGARLLEVNIWLHPNGGITVEGLPEAEDGERAQDYFHSEWMLAAKLMELTGRRRQGLVKPWSKTQTIEDWIAAGNAVKKIELPREKTAGSVETKPKITLTLEELFS